MQIVPCLGYRKLLVFRRDGSDYRQCTWIASCQGAPVLCSKQPQQLNGSQPVIVSNSQQLGISPCAKPICKVASRLHAIVFPKRFSSIPFLCDSG